MFRFLPNRRGNHRRVHVWRVQDENMNEQLKETFGEFIITEEERKKLEIEIEQRNENERQIFNAGMRFGKQLTLECMRKFIIEQRKEMIKDDK